MRMTKLDIQNLAIAIKDMLVDENLHGAVSIFYNNKRMTEITDDGCTTIEDGVSPFQYFDTANPRHILSMSFEGPFYDAINYCKSMVKKFQFLLDMYDLIYEQGDTWNLSVYPDDEKAYAQIEYTDYTGTETEKDEEIFIHLNSDTLPELKEIMQTWHDLAKAYGDVGSCVIGAGIKFRYQGGNYFMQQCSPWQGSVSWEHTMDKPMEMLRVIGAEDVAYYPGRMN